MLPSQVDLLSSKDCLEGGTRLVQPIYSHSGAPCIDPGGHPEPAAHERGPSLRLWAAERPSMVGAKVLLDCWGHLMVP